MISSAQKFLADLREEIETHPAVNHLFLNRLATSPFSRQDYRVFAENHYPLVCVFTHYLERLLVRAPDSEAKLWLAKVLVDEYGEGSEGKDHSTMYARYLQAAGGDPERVRTQRVAPPAHAFISAHRRIVSERPFLEGLGAVGPGHEWAIPKMFDAVIPGLRRAGFEEHEIAYFTLHVDQDGDHGAWLEEALASYATTAEAQEQIRRGALASLQARYDFWEGVQRQVVLYRQPRSVRQDGATPRPLGREILLTAWDAVPGSHALEQRWVQWRSRLRPTLVDVLAQTHQ
ncbi:MAG TPA: iron-containing redox enzyme family protein [Polyangiaceae bacterium]|nr:iron-containing redox enzyme family protein [Polyangiaceae bacterium]